MALRVKGRGHKMWSICWGWEQSYISCWCSTDCAKCSGAACFTIKKSPPTLHRNERLVLLDDSIEMHPQRLKLIHEFGRPAGPPFKVEVVDEQINRALMRPDRCLLNRF